MVETGTTECPSLAELEALAAEAALPDALADHLETCPSCRRQLDMVRQNNALLARLAEQVQGQVDGGPLAGHVVL